MGQLEQIVEIASRYSPGAVIPAFVLHTEVEHKPPVGGCTPRHACTVCRRIRQVPGLRVRAQNGDFVVLGTEIYREEVVSVNVPATDVLVERYKREVTVRRGQTKFKQAVVAAHLSCYGELSCSDPECFYPDFKPQLEVFYDADHPEGTSSSEGRLMHTGCHRAHGRYDFQY